MPSPAGSRHHTIKPAMSNHTLVQIDATLCQVDQEQRQSRQQTAQVHHKATSRSMISL
jgi:hypothetical protein